MERGKHRVLPFFVFFTKRWNLGIRSLSVKATDLTVVFRTRQHDPSRSSSERVVSRPRILKATVDLVPRLGLRQCGLQEWCWLFSTVSWLFLVERQLDLSFEAARLRGEGEQEASRPSSSSEPHRSRVVSAPPAVYSSFFVHLEVCPRSLLYLCLATVEIMAMYIPYKYL
ncbi:hypothetical protein Taro_051224 [Colocasia esculenta]|uniref:Uncharacterized protein n=1 Tax=Colocasia esculenta TaxID=4460 RepID=A0A843XGB2_COLES|nr:hypothetical protein [Colocasia esculenta]